MVGHEGRDALAILVDLVEWFTNASIVIYKDPSLNHHLDLPLTKARSTLGSVIHQPKQQ